MLDDAVAGFLDSVSERGLDEPLLAALRSLGFTNLHLTHGSAEFGKDLIGQLDGEQWAFQSKQGNINQSEFRQLTGQLDELRTNDLVHPEFRTDLPRRAVLVTTGRLVGNAGLSAQDYSRRVREKGEPELELWSRDRLIGLFAGDPNAVLRGSVDGQLPGLLDAIDRGAVDMAAMERFSMRWTNMEAPRVASLGMVEAAIACERLQARDRIDLACQLALCVVRGAWASHPDAEERGLAADAGAALFDTYAQRLWGSWSRVHWKMTASSRMEPVSSPTQSARYASRSFLGYLRCRSERGIPKQLNASPDSSMSSSGENREPRIRSVTAMG